MTLVIVLVAESSTTHDGLEMRRRDEGKILKEDEEEQRKGEMTERRRTLLSRSSTLRQFADATF